jgi:hypothetical protein
MTSLPAVVRAQYRGAHRILIVFDDGVEATINLRAWLKGPVFEPLKDLAYFRRFHLDGGTVVWPNGADIAPEALHAAALRAPGNRTRPGARETLARARIRKSR